MLSDSSNLTLKNENVSEDFLENLKDCGNHLIKLADKSLKLINELKTLSAAAVSCYAYGPVLGTVYLAYEILSNMDKIGELTSPVYDIAEELYAVCSAGAKTFNSAWNFTSGLFYSLWDNSQESVSSSDIPALIADCITGSNSERLEDIKIAGYTTEVNDITLDSPVVLAA